MNGQGMCKSGIMYKSENVYSENAQSENAHSEKTRGAPSAFSLGLASGRGSERQEIKK